MKSLEQELHCPVCKDIVKQPVVLPCQHSVCLMCASEVLVANGYAPPDLPPEPNSPASTPNTRSPRQARRPTPKAEQRPLDRVLRSGEDETACLMPQRVVVSCKWVQIPGVLTQCPSCFQVPIRPRLPCPDPPGMGHGVVKRVHPW